MRTRVIAINTIRFDAGTRGREVAVDLLRACITHVYTGETRY